MRTLQRLMRNAKLLLASTSRDSDEASNHKPFASEIDSILLTALLVLKPRQARVLLKGAGLSRYGLLNSAEKYLVREDLDRYFQNEKAASKSERSARTPGPSYIVLASPGRAGARVSGSCSEIVRFVFGMDELRHCTEPLLKVFDQIPRRKAGSTAPKGFCGGFVLQLMSAKQNSELLENIGGPGSQTKPRGMNKPRQPWKGDEGHDLGRRILQRRHPRGQSLSWHNAARINACVLTGYRSDGPRRKGRRSLVVQEACTTSRSGPGPDREQALDGHIDYCIHACGAKSSAGIRRAFWPRNRQARSKARLSRHPREHAAGDIPTCCPSANHYFQWPKPGVELDSKFLGLDLLAGSSIPLPARSVEKWGSSWVSQLSPAVELTDRSETVRPACGR
ncbi:uncharacterized protein MYCFIDRAFT_177967 [Pseudocercospora fijiensis CIRAD86]|uniref:Uncharacterized protein n=1 Tax=Pseudocercospora fijiensis (strain CIRAD86) TaxID=383855 RepID=M2YNR3_PSEFD|nr:uncharacterized protein MYCFIDRAFT_177967 [Pseudocercospora fijiensis CIRAD86]EME79365.1 hypothetical protein MYCFIDRAFT_177967 [Pseudocercospora fijiensis CIRAD86]